MQTETRTQLAAVLVMVVSLIASGLLAVELTASAGRNRMTYTDVSVDGQPPQVAMGIAMGAFRGLFVNFLWIRANSLKEEGRYYEAMDLAKAITTLQPRASHVWVFHAWNMAYNISVTTQTFPERWQWVNAGIDLLRREGIPNNPNDLLIHKELGWFFLHKIGGYLDDANLYYKRQLAAEWTLVLGPPPPSDTGMKDFETATQRFVDWLRPIADAPDTLAEVIKANPRVEELANRLWSEAGRELSGDLARNYVAHRAMATSGESILWLENMGERSQAFYRLVNDRAWEKEWADLLAFLRRGMLREEFNMEPTRMIRYTEMYGPIDWRHHAAHGLYWSARGVENALLRWHSGNKRDFDFVNAGRVVVQSLQDLWRSGDLFFDFTGWMKDPVRAHVFYRGSPNIHFMESYGNHLQDFVELSWADTDRSYGLYAAGYENFRKDAIRFLYRRGQRELAARMMDDLRVWPHQNTNDPQRRILFSLDIDEFVKKELEEALTRPSVVREEVIGSLHGAFLQGLLAGDDALFQGYMRYAALVHRYFFDQQAYQNHLDPNTLRMAQIDPDFRVVAGSEFSALLTMLELEDAEHIYDNAPRDLRMWGYDVLVARFKEGIEYMAELGGRSFDEIFPVPQGIEQHRAQMRRLDEQRQQRMPSVQWK
jgi:hypothetical protein